MDRRAALSPGELDLLKLIQKKGPMRLKKIQRDPLFHGWDIDSLKAAIERLSRMNMLSLEGDVLRTVHASLTERVASRHLAEIVARRFQSQGQ